MHIFSILNTHNTVLLAKKLRTSFTIEPLVFVLSATWGQMYIQKSKFSNSVGDRQQQPKEVKETCY